VLDDKRMLVEMYRTDLNKTFEANQVPFLLIAPDRDFNLLQQDLILEYNNSEYLPPQSLIDETRIRIENLVERSKKENFSFFDDILGRLDDVSVDKDRWVLKFSKTRYFHFAALNKGLDRPLLTMPRAISLRYFLNENPYDLYSSVLPNPLGIVTSLVLQPENKIILTIQSNRKFEGTGMMAASIGGSLSINEHDLDSSGLPDPFTTVVREANEELGINISTSDVRFFGLGRDLVTLEPVLIGQVCLDVKENDLLQIQKDQAKDEWEIEDMIIVDSKEIFKFLSMKNWSPPAWASTYLSAMNINRDQ
jgi:hypothetical protein